MLSRTGYGKGVDWWALGALCFEMVSGRPPFQARSQKDLDRKIMSEKFTAPPYLQASTHSLLKGLLEKDMYVTRRLFVAFALIIHTYVYSHNFNFFLSSC